MDSVPSRTERSLTVVKRALGVVAAAVVVRRLFYAGVDAFAFHLFGDPRPGRCGNGSHRQAA